MVQSPQMAGAATTLELATDSHAPRHSAVVRATHWLTVACFLALLVTGAEIVISHPRFYWGETGNFFTTPLFQLPVPSSRSMVRTGYGYVLPDQNGWSRALHFQSAWALLFTASIYLIWGLWTRHFGRKLLPTKTELAREGMDHLRLVRQSGADYNALQKIAYLVVIFILFPLVIWSGFAMSPAFVSALPSTVGLLGGQQSARTIHFFVSLALLLFMSIHVAMVWIAGFKTRVASMISGRGDRERV